MNAPVELEATTGPVDLRQQVVELWRVLQREERRRMIGVVALAGLVTGFELAQVGLLYPLMAVLVSPDAIERVPALSAMFARIPTADAAGRINVVVVLLLTVSLIKYVVMLLMWWMQASLVGDGARRVSDRFNAMYLCAPLGVIAARHSAEGIRNIRGLGQMVFSTSVVGLLTAAWGVFNALFLGMLLMLVDPMATLLAALAVGVLVTGQQRVLGQLFRVLGDERLELSRLAQRTLLHSFEAIKETKLMHREGFFQRRFGAITGHERRNTRRYQFTVQLPGVFNEFTLVVGLCCVIVVMVNSADDGLVVAQLALAIAAAYRFLPAVNRITTGLSGVRTGAPSVSRCLAEEAAFGRYVRPSTSDPAPEPLHFSDAIAIENLSYRFDGAVAPALAEVSFRARRGEILGIVGESGAGKTTLANVLLGLLPPSSGRVAVDGIDVSTCIERWQANLGLIPQQVVLSDDSLRENVAFGLEPDAIDEARVWRALGQAQLADFVRDLPNALDTPSGERGDRLSGGQRQRIGIARALYHDPEVLVLDEATAALDSSTEKRIGDAIFSLRGRKTVFIIAHRLVTLQRCDRLLLMDAGRLLAEGSFDELCAASAKFRELLAHSLPERERASVLSVGGAM